MKKTVNILVIGLFTIALILGYLIANTSMGWAILLILISAVCLAFSLHIVHKVDDELENKFYWYEQLLDAVPTPLSVTDLDMNWTFINKPVEQLFNEPKKDFIGRPCHNWGAAICQTEKCGIQRLRQGNAETYFSQFDKEFRVDTSYLYNRKGEPIGHVEVCMDITAITAVFVAAQLEKENKEQLEKAYLELKQTQDSLIESQKMASLGGLVAGISHEINTPIGICVMASSVINENLRKIVNMNTIPKDEQTTLIEMVVESNEIIRLNLERTIALVKSFKQVAVDQTSEVKYSFSVAENINHTLRTLKHELTKNNISVHVECSPDLEINNYPGVFTQIYTNLILNSIIHGFEGKKESNCINIDVKNDTKFLYIHYSDNGRGIEPTILSKVFEPFVTTKRGQGGSGLGTSIIYNLVNHKLNGNILCKSEQDKGCHFILKIPMQEQIDILEVT